MNIKNLDAVNILTKAIGVAAVGIIAYDANTAGKIESSSHQKQVKADSMRDAYVNTLSQDSPSIIKSTIKKKYLGLTTDENLSGTFTGIAGYVSGFGTMIVNNVLPLALSAGAIIKNPLSKFFGAGLLAYGGLFIGREVMGIGKPKPLSKDF